MKNNNENKKVVCRLDNLNLKEETHNLIKAQAKQLGVPVKVMIQIILDSIVPSLEIEFVGENKIEVARERGEE